MKHRRSRHTTVPKAHPPRVPRRPSPPPSRPAPARRAAVRHQAARIVQTSETSLLDVIDSLLNKGVVLNANVILALANVDLVYLRVSALLCAADRVMDTTSRGPRG